LLSRLDVYNGAYNGAILVIATGPVKLVPVSQLLGMAFLLGAAGWTAYPERA
jgi:hypothetical protein